MNAWPFIAFSIVFAVIVSAHFLLAFRSWRVSRQEETNEIDLNYVRLEDYFARSFRFKLSQWLKLSIQSSNPDGSRLIRKGRECIMISPAADYPPKSTSNDILTVEGSFKCGQDCTFHREILACGDASIGSGTHLQSITADGNLSMGTNVRIARWADSQGNIEIGAKSIIHSRATAGGTLLLKSGTQVQSAFAPLGCKSEYDLSIAEKFDETALPPDEFPACAINADSENQSTSGVDPGRLKMLTPDCWIYAGDFKPSKPLHFTAKLIVRGNCDIPSGSILEKDIKSRQSISVGAGCICRGSMVAEKAIVLGPFTRFYGILHAGKTLRLCAGVLGGTEKTNVAAFAEETLSVEKNVIVYGKLASAERVLAVPESTASNTNSPKSKE
jgi:predicted acyltransferase (DUF342 family)